MEVKFSEPTAAMDSIMNDIDADIHAVIVGHFKMAKAADINPCDFQNALVNCFINGLVKVSLTHLFAHNSSKEEAGNFVKVCCDHIQNEFNDGIEKHLKKQKEIKEVIIANLSNIFGAIAKEMAERRKQ